MGKQVRGVNTRIVAVTDTAFATPSVTPDTLILPYVSETLKADQTRDQDQTISGYRGMARSVAGQRKVSGTASINIAPQSIGFWLKHLLGTPTSAVANGVTTYTFGVAAQGAQALPPSFTLEKDFGPDFTAASRYQRLLGCRISQGAFSISPSGFATFTPTIAGSNSVASATPMDASPTDNGHKAFSTLTASLAFGGALVGLKSTKLDITFNNNMDDGQYVIGGGGTVGDIPEGMLDVSGSVDALLTDDSLLQAGLTDTDTSLVITLSNGDGSGTAGNESLTITIPALVFAYTTPTVSGPKGITLTDTFTAHRTAGEIGVTAVLKTPVATIQ